MRPLLPVGSSQVAADLLIHARDLEWSNGHGCMGVRMNKERASENLYASKGLAALTTHFGGHLGSA